MKKLINYTLGIFLILGLSGCAGKVSNMKVSTNMESILKIKKGKAKIIFMRPETLGYAIQSSVFLIKSDIPSIIGIVAAKKKISYDINPGKYTFMVAGESADFMYANLEANKIYYALVKPRMGWWKARFSLKPVNLNKINTKEFNKWLTECQLVEMNTDTKKWAKRNQNSINSK